MIIFLVIAAFLIILLYLWNFVADRQQEASLPPGPPRWPIIGNAYLMAGSDRHQRLFQTGKKYGGVFTMKMGIRTSVWITNYKLFREAMIDNAAALAARPPEFHIYASPTERGITASGVSEPDKEVRKFTLLSLRSFGFGKAAMQDAILHEANGIVEEFRKSEGQALNPRSIIANAAVNVVCAILLGRTFPQGDEHFRVLGEELLDGLKLLIKVQTMNSYPWLKLFSGKYREILDAKSKNGFAFMRKTVAEHVGTRSPGSPRDFVDTWLDKLESDDPQAQETFSPSKLPSIMLDLLTGGFETTATTFLWIFAMLLHHPEVQDKVHEEIDRILGNSDITLDHREQLAFTEATILETLRLFPSVPFAAPHMTLDEVRVGTYLLPANTRVITHLYSIHHDPDLWDDVGKFKPERFIKNGKLSVPEYFLPFSAGRRACIGEQLARKELFLFFATIMRNFRIESPAGRPLPSLKLNDEIVMYPDAFDIVVRAR